MGCTIFQDIIEGTDFGWIMAGNRFAMFPRDLGLNANVTASLPGNYVTKRFSSFISSSPVKSRGTLMARKLHREQNVAGPTQAIGYDRQNGSR